MKTAAQIVEDLGGATAVAAILEIPATTVASWKGRHSIPVQYWSPLIALAKDKGVKGITLENLAKLAAARAEPQRAVG